MSTFIGVPTHNTTCGYYPTWDSGVAVGAGALAVVLICAMGVTAYGALAAAAASLVGAVIVNGRAIGMALSRPA